MDKTVAWPGFEKFNSAQEILDRNKLLINEINHNHALKTPESLHRNVILIKELNSNVIKVADMYKDLSISFAELPAAQPVPNSGFTNG